ncbi:hypothetical protein HDV03_001326, partial [Kappamyces sp. JEL0829]
MASNYEDAMSQPYFKTLVAKGQLLTNYHGVSHPSQPNYVAMISGSTDGVILDFDSTISNRRTIVDLLEASGKSWTSYQEAYPGGCFTGTQSGTYRRKHNPFISFPSISGNPARCARIVDANRLGSDIAAGTVADYVFYSPDMNNNGHDTSLAYSMNWLQRFLDPKLNLALFKKTLFVVTWDENDAVLGVIDWKQNHIATVLVGAGAVPGSVDSTAYDHYSLLATIEKEWGLGGLNQQDVAAT